MSYTTESILEEWKSDAKIDRIQLGDAALRTGELHSKYMMIFYEERLKLMRLMDKQKKLKKLRFEYWDGKLSKEELDFNKWDPQPLKILKQDLPMYLDADEVMSEVNLRVGVQTEKVNILESIIKYIDQRMGFAIKTSVDWEKFQAGG